MAPWSRRPVRRFRGGHQAITQQQKDTDARSVITDMANYFNDLADIGDDDLGALGLFRRRKRRRNMGTRGVPARRLVPAIPGVPSRGLREQPMPLGTTAFTATSGTALTLAQTPARPFRGRRLVVDIARNGNSATGLVTINSLDVGADNQLPVPSGTGMPQSMFASVAVGVNLDMDPAGPGVGITLGLRISAAPGMTDTVDASAGVIGETVG